MTVIFKSIRGQSQRTFGHFQAPCVWEARDCPLNKWLDFESSVRTKTVVSCAVLACGGTQGDIGRQRIRGKQNVVRNFASKSSCQSVGRFDKSWSSHPLFRCANLTNAATSIIIATLPSPMIVAPETPATLR